MELSGINIASNIIKCSFNIGMHLTKKVFNIGRTITVGSLKNVEYVLESLNPDEQKEEKAKKFVMSDLSRKILEEWFSKNIENPYPDKRTKIELSKQTKLSIKQISYWFIDRRRKSKRIKSDASKRLSLDSKLALRRFFEKKQRPGPKDISKIAFSSGISEKKVRAWFAYERFKAKNK